MEVAGERILWDRRKEIGFGRPWLTQHGCNALVRSDQGNRKGTLSELILVRQKIRPRFLCQISTPPEFLLALMHFLCRQLEGDTECSHQHVKKESSLPLGKVKQEGDMTLSPALGGLWVLHHQPCPSTGHSNSIPSLPVCLAFLLARRVSSRSWMMTCSTLKKNFWVDVLDVNMDIEGSWSSRPPRGRF